MKNALALIATFCLLAFIGAGAAFLTTDRTSGEIIRYAERRLIGHPKLEALFSPLLERWRATVERPAPERLPSLGKGQQAVSLPAQTYSPDGVPLPVRLANGVRVEVPREPSRLISDMTELQRALAEAVPGQTIEMAPGIYRMEKSLRLRNGGTPGSPVVVRAQTPGSVIIRSTAAEGFHILGPYWIFENLTLKGVCSEHSNCEHAFHVVGRAHGVVIRNNRIEDFNAQIKVNGLEDHWPDHGLIQYNTLLNSAPRNTGNPVTPIDIVGASGWNVADNDIRNFIKAGGNRIAFGVFMKGGGEGGQIERNLIVCAGQSISENGKRVGLSFGGGGTDPGLCRDRRCVVEHLKGAAINNVVAHCNDFGIDVNGGAQILVAHNTLINTYGIDVRSPNSSAHVVANLADGVIRARGGASTTEAFNQRRSLAALFESADALGLGWRVPPDSIDNAGVTDDFCGSRRTNRTFVGSTATTASCAP